MGELEKSSRRSLTRFTDLVVKEFENPGKSGSTRLCGQFAAEKLVQSQWNNRAEASQVRTEVLKKGKPVCVLQADVARLKGDGISALSGFNITDLASGKGVHFDSVIWKAGEQRLLADGKITGNAKGVDFGAPGMELVTSKEKLGKPGPGMKPPRPTQLLLKGPALAGISVQLPGDEVEQRKFGAGSQRGRGESKGKDDRKSTRQQRRTEGRQRLTGGKFAGRDANILTVPGLLLRVKLHQVAEAPWLWLQRVGEILTSSFTGKDSSQFNFPDAAQRRRHLLWGTQDCVALPMGQLPGVLPLRSATTSSSSTVSPPSSSSSRKKQQSSTGSLRRKGRQLQLNLVANEGLAGNMDNGLVTLSGPFQLYGTGKESLLEARGAEFDISRGELKLCNVICSMGKGLQLEAGDLLWYNSNIQVPDWNAQKRGRAPATGYVESQVQQLLIAPHGLSVYEAR